MPPCTYISSALFCRIFGHLASVQCIGREPVFINQSVNLFLLVQQNKCWLPIGGSKLENRPVFVYLLRKAYCCRQKSDEMCYFKKQNSTNCDALMQQVPKDKRVQE